MHLRGSLGQCALLGGGGVGGGGLVGPKKVTRITAIVIYTVCLVAGTAKERGLLEWRRQVAGDQTTSSGDADIYDVTQPTRQRSLATYDFPFGMARLRSVSWARFLPISPTFQMDDDSGPPIELLSDSHDARA